MPIASHLLLADVNMVTNYDGAVTIRNSQGGYMLMVPCSRAEGGKYFLDQRLHDIVGDCTSGSSTNVSDEDRAPCWATSSSTS
jgi:hypothetical protein